MTLKRYDGNPILRPKPQHKWESERVFNPAIICRDGLFHLLYRGMGADGISRIGYAVSLDGFDFFRFDRPVFSPKLMLEPRGCEDPRLVELNGKFHMTYTAYSDDGTRIGVAFTENFLSWERLEVNWPEVNNKDAVLLPEKIGGEYVLFHRPTVGECMGIWVAYSDDLVNWHGQTEIMSPLGPGTWEEKIGAGPPPIRTRKGWLLIYHGVDGDGVYRAGAAMFDLTDPSKLLHRHPHPILEPEEDYEVRGVIPRVVFPCGICEIDSEYYIYYGGADRVVCVATADRAEILRLFP